MMIRKMILIIFRISLFFLSLSLILLAVAFTVNTLQKNRDVPGLILERVEINGSTQWISLTEKPSESHKPVTLFLHGGPGSANISLLNTLCPGLKEHTVVVNWDQRNAGKSFQLFSSKSDLTLEQIVEDGHVLTQYLKEKYGVEKISLLGFSAGTVPGLLLMDRYPEDYHLFMSVSQMVHGKRGELLSLEYVLQKAKERNDLEAINKLKKISFDFSDPKSILKNTQRQREYLLQYGGVYHLYESYAHEAWSLWKAKEYTLFDFIFWPLASQISLRAMWPELVLIEMDRLVPAVTVPIVFLSGVHDWNNPTHLVQEYYESIDAPMGKEIILFEHSAHGIFWDEPERFEKEVIYSLNKYVIEEDE